jgi:mannose-6-phosphate isomerase-like protein (cupin superfamily)
VDFDTRAVPADHDVIAPDGSEVRILLSVDRGSAAHFQLGPGQTSIAIRHRSVDEIWYVVNGTGEMWRRTDQREETVPLRPSTCVTIPRGTAFQFRTTGPDDLAAIGITMPPWPGDGEAIACDGPWTATVAPGPGLAPA